jgi:hypothetical protein
MHDQSQGAYGHDDGADADDSIRVHEPILPFGAGHDKQLPTLGIEIAVDAPTVSPAGSRAGRAAAAA